MTSKSVSRSVEIAAPVEAVWRALSDATELVRWFPLEARIEPGEGGSISLGWADGHTSQGRVEIWEPGKRLQYVGLAGPWNGIVTDYSLETAQGKTVLRVVSSGFDGLTDWEDVVGAFGRGWDFELQGLRHYLEYHPGLERRVARARVPYRRRVEKAWARIAGPMGWLGSRGLGKPEESSRYSVTLATGEEFSGVVHNFQPPHQFSGTVEEFNNALFRIHFWNGDLYVWLSTYGIAGDVVRDLTSRWQASLLEVAF